MIKSKGERQKWKASRRVMTLFAACFLPWKGKTWLARGGAKRNPWDLLLTAGGIDPDGLGRVAASYARWMQQYYDAIADSEVEVVYSHDDLVWTRGPVFHPDWYRKYIFPHYVNYYAPSLAKGKKVLFVSDGNYQELALDIAKTGVSGFFFEPLTDLKFMVEHFGKTHVLIGNADTRKLLFGSKQDIRNEVQRCYDTAKDCPGWFMGVTNMIPHNTPIEAALYYDKCVREMWTR
jgi:uroporphyrinogen-III decarboxylase